MKKTIEEVRDWLLENAVDEEGDLYLSELDFSNFNGDVYINYMKVQGNLFQHSHKVQGDLFQHSHKVQGNYYSKDIEVEGNIAFDEPKKLLKKITADELKEMGYELV